MTRLQHHAVQRKDEDHEHLLRCDATVSKINVKLQIQILRQTLRTVHILPKSCCRFGANKLVAAHLRRAFARLRQFLLVCAAMLHRVKVRSTHFHAITMGDVADALPNFLKNDDDLPNLLIVAAIDALVCLNGQHVHTNDPLILAQK